jgi:hypothetical protein
MLGSADAETENPRVDSRTKLPAKATDAAGELELVKNTGQAVRSLVAGPETLPHLWKFVRQASQRDSD